MSSWLFPGASEHHRRDVSVDSVTNLPRPIGAADGFYQTVARGGARQPRHGRHNDNVVVSGRRRGKEEPHGADDDVVARQQPPCGGAGRRDDADEDADDAADGRPRCE